MKAQMKNATSYPLPGADFEDMMNGMDSFGGKAKTTAKKGKGLSKTVLKAKPKLPEDNFQEKYKRFGGMLELDVFTTVQKDMQEMADIKR